MTVLDAQRGAALKQAGMAQALENSGEWVDIALTEFRGWAKAQKRRGLTTITIEQFRAQALHQPPSHKAWGGFAYRASKAGLIRPTGQFVLAAAPRTRSHPIRTWEIV